MSETRTTGDQRLNLYKGRTVQTLLHCSFCDPFPGRSNNPFLSVMYRHDVPWSRAMQTMQMHCKPTSRTDTDTRQAHTSLGLAAQHKCSAVRKVHAGTFRSKAASLCVSEVWEGTNCKPQLNAFASAKCHKYTKHWLASPQKLRLFNFEFQLRLEEK